MGRCHSFVFIPVHKVSCTPGAPHAASTPRILVLQDGTSIFTVTDGSTVGHSPTSGPRILNEFVIIWLIWPEQPAKIKACFNGLFWLHGFRIY